LIHSDWAAISALSKRRAAARALRGRLRRRLRMRTYVKPTPLPHPEVRAQRASKDARPR
jgi:hypothetical protein